MDITNNDHQFRIILLAGFAAVLPFAMYYRIRSQASGEKLDRLQEGLLLLIGIRALGLAHWLGVIAYLINPDNMSWSGVALPLWSRWLGVGLGVPAGLLLLLTFHHLGTNLTDTVVTRKKHTLVTGGPYRWVRHPFYVAAALAILANALTTANWFIFITGGVAFLLLVVRTDKEEAKLIDRFGDDYRQYMQRTGRFIPKLKTGNR